MGRKKRSPGHQHQEQQQKKIQEDNCAGHPSQMKSQNTRGKLGKSKGNTNIFKNNNKKDPRDNAPITNNQKMRMEIRKRKPIK